MIQIRRGKDRGQTKIGWLDARHTFSFGHYYDEDHMGFRTLRVINQDRISGGGGFPMHGHSDMEIITYVMEGELAHEDSLGHKSVLRPQGVQIITAGTGVTHSEFNHSADGVLHLLQMWIEPDREAHEPRYSEKVFNVFGDPGKLHLVGSQDGRAGSLKFHQAASLYVARLRPGDKINHEFSNPRLAWIHLAAGEIFLNGVKMSDGDGAAISLETELNISAAKQSDTVLFDLF